MRQFTDIAVTQAAVHLVAPRRGELRRSTAAIDLDDATIRFLAGHVSKGLADGSALAGKFKVRGPKRAEGLCRAIVKSSQNFVPRSAALAKLLYDASATGTTTDSRIADGALLVARCSGTEGDQRNIPFVALLKLDPNDAFRTEEGVASDGSAIIRLVIQPDTLPTPKERLQKAAFVRDEDSAYDALAVDRQRSGEVVSAFFLDSFLGLEHVFDDRERTTRLYRTARRAVDAAQGDLTPDEYTQMDQYVNGVMVGAQVDVDDMLENLPAPPEVKARFADAVNSEITDRQFALDQLIARKLLKSRRFRGSNGLLVRVNSEFFNSMVTAVPPQTPGDLWTVTIRTAEWTDS